MVQWCAKEAERHMKHNCNSVEELIDAQNAELELYGEIRNY